MNLPRLRFHDRRDEIGTEPSLGCQHTLQAWLLFPIHSNIDLEWQIGSAWRLLAAKIHLHIRERHQAGLRQMKYFAIFPRDSCDMISFSGLGNQQQDPRRMRSVGCWTSLRFEVLHSEGLRRTFRLHCHQLRWSVSLEVLR